MGHQRVKKTLEEITMFNLSYFSLVFYLLSAFSSTAMERLSFGAMAEDTWFWGKLGTSSVITRQFAGCVEDNIKAPENCFRICKERYVQKYNLDPYWQKIVTGFELVFDRARCPQKILTACICHVNQEVPKRQELPK